MWDQRSQYGRLAVGIFIFCEGQPLSNIGTLRTVSPREAWAHEAQDFTPWLSEHLATLGDELGILLEFEGMEQSVGGYYADIVARCPRDDRIVLIENQL